MNSRERVLAALNHKMPDRVPVDFGSFPWATSMNVRAYQNLLEHLGIKREVRIGALIMFTAEIDEDILNRFHVDTKSVGPSKAIGEFGIPEEFIDQPWGVKWQRSTDFTYAPVEGPFQRIARPTADDVKNYRWPKPAEIADFTAWREKGKKLRQESDKALVAPSLKPRLRLRSSQFRALLPGPSIQRVAAGLARRAAPLLEEERDPARGVDVGRLEVADVPAGRGEQLINPLTGPGLWAHQESCATP